MSSDKEKTAQAEQPPAARAPEARAAAQQTTLAFDPNDLASINRAIKRLKQARAALTREGEG